MHTKGPHTSVSFAQNGASFPRAYPKEIILVSFLNPDLANNF
jgi:hypothetical protein